MFYSKAGENLDAFEQSWDVVNICRLRIVFKEIDIPVSTKLNAVPSHKPFWFILRNCFRYSLNVIFVKQLLNTRTILFWEN